MIGAIAQGMAGLQAGFERMDGASARIARDGAPGDLAGQIVETMRAQEEVGVNATTIRSADDLIGSLLDELA